MSGEVADVIDGAADVLDRHGWIQGALATPDGVCAIGALRVALRLSVTRVGTEPPSPTPVWLFKVIEDEIFVHRNVPRMFAGIADWNDAPGRTADEVKDVFRAAAKRQRAEER